MSQRQRTIPLGLLVIVVAYLLLPQGSGASGGGTDLNQSASKSTIAPGEKVTLGLGERPSPCPVRWDFGDGGTGEGWPVTHTYAQPGNYTVRAAFLCDVQATPLPALPATIKVVDSKAQPPRAVIATSLTSVVAFEQSVRFDASASRDSKGGSAISHYRWDFGDGGKAEGVTAEHVYKKLGSFKATLIISDRDTNTDDSTSVAVSVAAPAGGMPPASSPPATPAPRPTAAMRPAGLERAPFALGQPGIETSGLNAPRLDTSFSLIHLGVWQSGAAIPAHTFVLLRDNPQNVLLRGTVSSNSPWLKADPPAFDTTAGLSFSFSVPDSKLLLPGQTNWAQVNININGALYEVAVAVTVGGLSAAQAATIDTMSEQVATILQSIQKADLLVTNDRYANPGQFVQGLAAHYVLNAGYKGRMPATTWATRGAELVAASDLDRDGWIGFTAYDRSIGALGEGYIAH